MPNNDFKTKYRVVVMDMFDYGKSYDHSDYYTYEEALCMVKEVISTSISKSGKEGVEEWWLFGETAYILSINGAPPCPKFDDAEFVRQLCGVKEE